MKSTSRQQAFFHWIAIRAGLARKAVACVFVSALIAGCNRSSPVGSSDSQGSTVATSGNSTAPLPSRLDRAKEIEQPAEAGLVIARNTEPPVDSLALREEAKRTVEELVRLLPGNPDSLEMKARIHLLLGENDAAKATWEESLKIAPNYAYAIQGLGRIAMRSGEHLTAIESFKKVSGLLPGSPDPPLDLAEAYTKLGQIDEAISVLSESAKVNSTSTVTFIQLGQAYLTNRKFEEAKQAFEKALAISPETPRAQQGLATALLRLGNRPEAEKLLLAQKSQRSTKNRTADEVFLDEKRDISDRYELLSKVYLDQGMTKKAEEILLRSLVLDPTNTDACELLRKIYFADNRQADTLEISKRLCELAPTNASYLYDYGVLLQRHARSKEAAEAFQKVVELQPESPPAYDALVRSLITARQRLDQALEFAKKLVALRGSAADNELLGQAFAVNGDLKNAKHHLEIAIELAPSNQAYSAAMKQLKKALGEPNE